MAVKRIGVLPVPPGTKETLPSLTGLAWIAIIAPTDKSVGYYRSSLRDWPRRRPVFR